MIEEDAIIAVRDGTRIGARVYRPEGSGPYPALPHYYRPDKIGADTIYHDRNHPSELVLPVATAE
jgi:predicted acyl esterase